MVVLILVLLGLCLGSFVNALVWRLHEQSKSKKPSQKLSILKGQSMCPQCKHRLYARDLVPVLSWIELRGRCRYCRTSISWQYPLVELLTTVLFVISYNYWPYGLTGWGLLTLGGWLLCLVVLMALFVYDLRWMLLPNRLVTPLTLIATVTVIARSVTADAPSLLSSIIGSVCLSGLFYLLFQVSQGRWIGGGDVKIAVALGLLGGGLLESALILFAASLLGTLVSVPLLLTNPKASHKVPFGPFLITATVFVFIWGSSFLEWFNRTILLV